MIRSFCQPGRDPGHAVIIVSLAALPDSTLSLLIQGDAPQWSEKTRSRPIMRGSEYPTKLTEPRLLWLRHVLENGRMLPGPR